MFEKYLERLDEVLDPVRAKESEKLQIMSLKYKKVERIPIILVLLMICQKKGFQVLWIGQYVKFTTLILKSIFDTIPKEIEESAMIDGCTRINSFFKIIAPIGIGGILLPMYFLFYKRMQNFFMH